MILNALFQKTAKRGRKSKGFVPKLCLSFLLKILARFGVASTIFRERNKDHNDGDAKRGQLFCRAFSLAWARSKRACNSSTSSVSLAGSFSWRIRSLRAEKHSRSSLLNMAQDRAYTFAPVVQQHFRGWRKESEWKSITYMVGESIPN